MEMDDKTFACMYYVCILYSTVICHRNAAPKTHLSEAVPNPESFTIAHEHVARTAEISNPIPLPSTIVVHSNTYYLVVVVVRNITTKT